MIEKEKKILLVALNAKYIHSNLAVYSLRAYAAKHGMSVELAEYTINHRTDYILEEIYRKHPDVICFSCYIWNIEQIRELAWELHRLLPQVPIWGGGPEVSYETEKFLTENPAFTGLMCGEGEKTFLSLCEYYKNASLPCTMEDDHIAKTPVSCTTEQVGYEPVEMGNRRPESDVLDGLRDISGLVFRQGDGFVHTPPREPMNMDELPFCYDHLEDFQNRIIYYESSRGGPYSCSYCLSSVDKRLRFRSLELVLPELQFFIDRKVPQVKFVDRTFNCSHEHAMGIWKYLVEHDNGITNFHFEVSADLLRPEEIALMKTMRPGLIQLEIGVQSVNPVTIREIHRTMNLSSLEKIVQQIHAGRNIHQHLDLIAGLPFEDFESFRHSFDEIYALRPQQLQLGFLKVLKGSYMYEHAQEYEILYSAKAPYEVLATKWISFDDVLNIRLVEEMLELHYNSGQFVQSLRVLEQAFDSAFTMYWEMGLYYLHHGLRGQNFSRMKRCEIFLDFAMEKDPAHKAWYEQALTFDLYARENMKRRPAWAPDLSGMKKAQMQYLREHGLEKNYCHMEPFDREFLEKFTAVNVEACKGNSCTADGADITGSFSEKQETVLNAYKGLAVAESLEMVSDAGFEDVVWVLFDYEHRDALTGDAVCSVVNLSTVLQV